MGILRSQLVNMNQHYRRFSLDYFLDCQQRLGIRQIELWCGASHFWLDHEGTGDVPALKQKLLDHDVRVVSVTAPASPTSISTPRRSRSCWSTPSATFPTPFVWPPNWVPTGWW